MINRPRGVADILPGQSEKWQALEALLRQMCREYGYHEVRIPMFEETGLYLRGVGDTTDIVQKEMYTFEDHGGRSMTLRPEATSGLCRAYVENKMQGLPQPVKVTYMGPMFRYEKPQAGRYRQFHQFDIEIFGSYAPAADAEIISFVWDLYDHRLGIRNLELRINSVGCPKCRAEYRKALQEYFRPHLDRLCKTCQDRFDRNPMRILDCKSAEDQAIGKDAPVITDYLCEECHDHFEQVKALLDAASIPYVVDPRIVRGLDYYTKTTFEIQVTAIGAQSAICGGGRYDGLMEEIGGPPTGGVGVALGMERVFAALAAQGDDIEVEADQDVYLVNAAGEAGMTVSFALADKLRRAGISVEMEYGDRSFKAQMKAANRVGAAYAVILGEDELARSVATVRDMANSEQNEVPLDELVCWLSGR